MAKYQPKKTFFFKLILISLPVLLFFAWQLSLSPAQYQFRAWEALISNNGISNNPFLPNQHLELDEVGDLVPYTSDSILKHNTWNTDEFGFRNETPLCPNPELVIFGDSMAVGTSISDRDTIASQVQKETHLCVRSLAGGRPNQPLGFLHALQLKPKRILVVLAERNIGVIDEIAASEKSVILPNPLTNLIARLKKFSYWNFRKVHGIRAALERSQDRDLSSPKTELAGDSIPMHFLGKTDGSEGLDETALKLQVERINRFTDDLKKQNIELVLALVPNKESIYPERAGVPNPQFYTRFHALRENFHFHFLDLFQAYETAKRENPKLLLYHLDDTHWNARGVEILARLYQNTFDR